MRQLLSCRIANRRPGKALKGHLVIPAKAGIISGLDGEYPKIPAFAGMTADEHFVAG